MSDIEKPWFIRLARGLFRLIAGLFVIWLLLVVLFLWPFIFHDYNKVSEQDMAAVLSSIGLSSESVALAQAYYAPPNWAGDYTRTFCLTLRSTPSLSGFVAGGRLVTAASKAQPPYAEDTVNMMTSFLESARQEAEWLPAVSDWLTDRYAIKLLYTGSSSAHFAWLDSTGNTACFLAYKW